MGEVQKHILVVDDDPKIRRLLRNCFEPEGFVVSEAENGDEIDSCLNTNRIDLITLDLNLGVENGLTIASSIKVKCNIPIIIVTGKGDVIDRVSGLELGADDYIGKPFEPRELVARVQATLRRSELTGPTIGELNFEGLSIETETRTVKVDGEVVDLTSMEYELLLILARRHGRKLSRDDILSELRGIDAAILTRSVDIMISRLRQKLGDSVKPPRFIQTVWGRGYSFVGVPTADA